MKKWVFTLIFLILVILILGVTTQTNLIEKYNDLKGELFESKQQQDISIFVLPAVPIISILSPENKIYTTTEILLNYSAIKADTIWYNLDNTENITITQPTDINIPQGAHILYLYANNTEGTSVKNISFFIEIPAEPVPSGVSEGRTSGVGSKKEKVINESLDEKEEEEKTEEETKEPEKEIPIVEKIIKPILSNKAIWIIVIIVIVTLVLSEGKKRKK